MASGILGRVLHVHGVRRREDGNDRRGPVSKHGLLITTIVLRSVSLRQTCEQRQRLFHLRG
jgi:hypothetical protein